MFAACCGLLLAGSAAPAAGPYAVLVEPGDKDEYLPAAEKLAAFHVAFLRGNRSKLLAVRVVGAIPGAVE